MRLPSVLMAKRSPAAATIRQSSSGILLVERSCIPFKVIPVLVYRVYADGRPDLLVRGADIVGTPLASFSKILATGDKPEVFNGYCGAESGSVPIKLWDVGNGSELRTLQGHADTVESVAFSPDGKTLASGSGDRTIKLWTVGNGKELNTLKYDDAVRSVAFSPDGKTLAGCSFKISKLWDVASGKELHTLQSRSGWIYSVAFSPDGKTLASVSWDKIIELWDVASGKELRTP